MIINTESDGKRTISAKSLRYIDSVLTRKEKNLSRKASDHLSRTFKRECEKKDKKKDKN